MKVILVASVSGLNTERHFRAMKSWSTLIEMGMECVLVRRPNRSAKDIGDERELPYLKDLINDALSLTTKLDDVIVWTNDDVQLEPEILDYCRSVVRIIGAVSMRRTEPGVGGVHMGRELFAFTHQWLRDNLGNIPDFLIGAPAFDLVLAALIRKTRGIDSTLENMSEDIYPCDSDRRYAIHEPHPSAWAGPKEFTFPANNHNRKLAKEWCAAHMPSLKL